MTCGKCFCGQGCQQKIQAEADKFETAFRRCMSDHLAHPLLVSQMHERMTAAEARLTALLNWVDENFGADYPDGHPGACGVPCAYCDALSR